MTWDGGKGCSHNGQLFRNSFLAVVDRGARSLDGRGWRLLLRPGIAPATGTVSTWETILVTCSILAPLRALDLRMNMASESEI